MSSPFTRSMRHHLPNPDNGLARSITLLVVVFAASASLLLSDASGRENRGVASAAGPHPLLGITGNLARFKSQTGQDSSVDQAFLGWDQGLSYGTPFAAFFPTLAPIPMIHLGTKGKNLLEAITPGGIASGTGDSYLIALNHAIAGWGKAIYVRPMAEMNNAGNFYSGYAASGQPRDAAHSPATYRKAFARIYLILHGGTASAIDARLKAARDGSSARRGDLLVNPFPTLRVVWSPLASSNPRVAGQRGRGVLPGPELRRRRRRRHLRRAAHGHRTLGRSSKPCSRMRSDAGSRSRFRNGDWPTSTTRRSCGTCAPSCRPTSRPRRRCSTRAVQAPPTTSNRSRTASRPTSCA